MRALNFSNMRITRKRVCKAVYRICTPAKTLTKTFTNFLILDKKKGTGFPLESRPLCHHDLRMK